MADGKREGGILGILVQCPFAEGPPCVNTAIDFCGTFKTDKSLVMQVLSPPFDRDGKLNLETEEACRFQIWKGIQLGFEPKVPCPQV